MMTKSDFVYWCDRNPPSCGPIPTNWLYNAVTAIIEGRPEEGSQEKELTRDAVVGRLHDIADMVKPRVDESTPDAVLRIIKERNRAVEALEISQKECRRLVTKLNDIALVVARDRV